jgi:hypothetical protein
VKFLLVHIALLHDASHTYIPFDQREHAFPALPSLKIVAPEAVSVMGSISSTKITR